MAGRSRSITPTWRFAGFRCPPESTRLSCGLRRRYFGTPPRPAGWDGLSGARCWRHGGAAIAGRGSTEFDDHGLISSELDHGFRPLAEKLLESPVNAVAPRGAIMRQNDSSFRCARVEELKAILDALVEVRVQINEGERLVPHGARRTGKQPFVNSHNASGQILPQFRFARVVLPAAEQPAVLPARFGKAFKGVEKMQRALGSHPGEQLRADAPERAYFGHVPWNLAHRR